MIGLVVNPVAGLGGSVGLKGTDGMVEQARALGAIPHAHERAALALRQLPPELPIACAGATPGRALPLSAQRSILWPMRGVLFYRWQRLPLLHRCTVLHEI